MDPLRTIFNLVTNLTSRLVGFVNGLFEPKVKSTHVGLEEISAVKNKTKTENKTETISAVKPTKPTKPEDKPTFKTLQPNKKTQTKQIPHIGTQGIDNRRGLQGVNSSFSFAFEDDHYRPKDKTKKKKTRIALNDENDIIDVFWNGSSYTIE